MIKKDKILCILSYCHKIKCNCKRYLFLYFMRTLLIVFFIGIGQITIFAQQARELNNAEQQKVEQLLEQLNEFYNSGDYEKAGKTSSDIAFIYLMTGNLKESIKYYTMSVEYLTEVDNLDMLPNVYSNIAGIYNTQGEYQAALDYFLKSLNIRIKSGNKKSVLVGSLDVASSYQVLGFNSEAIEYLEEGLGLATDINNPRLTLDCYHLLAQNNEQLGYEKEAEAWYAKAEKLQAYLEEQSSKEENIAELTKPRKEVEKTGKEKELESELSALHQVRAQQETDSINASFRAKQDSLFEAAQVARVKQYEIKLLEQARELDAAKIEQQESNNAKQRLIILSVVIGFILLILVVVVLIRVNRSQKRAKAELERQNKELAEKNEQMIKDMLK